MKRPDSDHTFVIPVYGDSPYLSDCIRALLNQSVKSRIHIATSTPSSYIEKTAANFNIPVFVNPQKKGIAADWNFASSCSETKYFTIAHQDDIYLSDYTAKCLEMLENSATSLIAFTDYSEIYSDIIRERTPLLMIKRLMLYPFFTFNSSLSAELLKRLMLSAGSSICCPSVMFNKKRIGKIEFKKEMTINMDWSFWMELAGRKGSFHYVKERLVHHRIHPDSETSKGLETDRRQAEDRYMFKKIWPSPIAEIISKFYALSYISNR